MPLRRFNSVLHKAITAVILCCAALYSSPAAANTFNVFGKTYFRQNGAPVTDRDGFSVFNPDTQYTLHVQNSGVSSAVILVNGVQILGPSDFNPNVTVVDRTVNLQATNEIEVQLRSKPGSSLTISIVGIDNEPPVITASAAPKANAFGWNNSNVVVTFTCSDRISGVASCPSPVTISSEGANQVISGTATDRAGNTASTSITLNIDRSPPAVTDVAAPQANAAGWNNTPVTVSFMCSDSLSGIATCPASVQVSTQGAGQVITGTATDKAGNQATASVKLNIDTTPPVIAASASPTPNSSGWNNTEVTITFRCSDDGSGIATCPPPQTINKEGANQVVTGSATDIAGNFATSSVTLNIAKTAPKISASVAPPPNAAGWNNGDVTISFQCANSIPGDQVVSCPAPITVNTEGVNQVIAGTATDIAGNTAQATATVNVDKSPPTITALATPPANPAGWNNTDVVVTFTCADGLSGIASCPARTTVSSEGGSLPVSGTATDIAGNSAQASLTLKIDKTPPFIVINSPPGGAILRTPQAPISGTVSDALSGIASANCNGASATVVAGGALSCTATLMAGPNILTITAIDAAGNAASAQVSVAFVLPPVANAGSGYSGVPGTPVAFSAAASTDPDNSPMTFSWDFGDGNSGTGITVMHAYSQAGTYTVKLVLTDQHGGIAQATTSATIVQPDLPPTVNANGPYSGVAGSPIAFTGTGSSPTNNPLTFTWAFGDGTFAANSTTAHTYKLPGTYTATLTASDGQLSTSATAFVTVTPANRPPVVSAGGPYSGVTGTPVNFTATGSDPDNDPVSFTWDFGDGGSGSGATVSHIFTAPGSYTVKITANDGRGGVTSATATAAISQANRPPHSNPGGPYSGQAKTRMLFNGSASSDPDNDPLTYLWDFGDGSAGSGVAPNHGYATAGNYTVSLTVDDGRGGKDTATTSVTVTTAVATPNQPPVARPGGPYSGEAGSVVPFNGSASSDPDGDALTFSWDLGDGNKATGAAPTHIYSTPGTYSVALSVDDGNGNVTTATTSAVITPAADHIPPHITLSAPSKILPGATVTITASATDNVGVASVTFDIDGAPSSTVTAPPYQRVLNIPSVATPGATITVRATAADAAGNTAVAQTTLTIDATPETQAPTVTLNAPTNAAPNSVIILTATASDTVGVASVTFSAAGSQVATVPIAPYESTYTVPATTAIGSTIQFTAHATNFSGNSSDATAIVTIVQQVANANPPTVSISVPPSVTAGSSLNLGANVSGTNGVSTVSFYVEGELIGAAVQSPYAATFNVPQSAVPGSIVHIDVRADDFNGNEGHATAQTVVTAAEKAIVIGQVLDDSSGLLLQGANVSLTGTDLTGAAYTQTAQTDDRGRFEIHAPAGMAVLVISNDGMTRVDRLVNLQSGSTSRALDARLTPLAPPAGPVSGVLGGALTSDAGSLSIPAGAASSSANLTLTTISQQGIQGTLPPGWSPVSSIDIAPHGTGIPGATVSVPNALQYAAGTSLTLAKWDEGVSAWRALGQALVSADATNIQGPVDGTGEYAVLAADTQPSSPPNPNAGDLLTGIASSLVPTDAMSLVIPKPKVIVYSPGVNSDVAGSFTSNLPLPSGTVLSSVITESYKFFSGAEIHPEPFTIDLVAYQTTADGKQQSAMYKVSPSQTFEPLTLQSGVIDVQLLAPTSATAPISTIGSSGGTLTAPTNESIQLPPGAVPQAIPVQISGLAASDLGMPMPSGVDFLGAMRLDFVGTLALPARVSIPTPASLGDTTGILLVRLQELQGQTRMVLVGTADVAGDHIISDVALAGTTKTFEGVRVAGRYVFVHMQALTAFAAGSVIGADGNPFLGAMVSNPAIPIISLSRATDGYIAVGAVGPTTFTAQDLVRSGVGTGSLTFANQNEVDALDLHLVEQPPTVVSIVPSNGTISVSLDTAVVITFSQALDPNGVTGATPNNITLTAPDGSAVASSIAFSSGNSVVTLRPNASLQPNTAYTITITTGIANLSGDQLAAPVTATFTSLDIRAPPPPPAGSISASIPTNGQTIVTATQGTAALHNTVTIINFTTGQVTPVLVQPDGSFSTNVAASTTDKIQIKISNGSGNDTTVNLPRFSQTNSDGSVSAAIDSSGGHIDGPGGTAVDVPAGSLPDGTVVNIQQVPESNFPIILTDVQKQVFTYSGGIALDFGGATPAKYVNISIPAGPNDTTTDQWVVGQVVNIGGSQLLNPVDTAHVINGRITTSSPPCPGVTGSAVYGIYKSHTKVGVTYGVLSPHIRVSANVSLPNSLDSFFLPWDLASSVSVSAAVCLPVLTGNVTVSPNTVNIDIPSQALTPQDREIVITDLTRNNLVTQSAEYHFPRDVVEYTFTVLGEAEDHFQVAYATFDGISHPINGKFFDVSQASPGTATVTLNADKINVAIQSVTIVDQSVDPPTTNTFPDPNARTPQSVNLTFTVPGIPSDSYEIDAVSIDPKVGRHQLILVPAPTPVPTQAGVTDGNLIATAADGSIDPTAAEIAANPTSGISPSLGRSAVYLGDLQSQIVDPNVNPCAHSICIQVPDDRIINGGFTWAFNGDVTHQWEIVVTYDDGRIDREGLPFYRLIVTNQITGEILHTISQLAPKPGKPVNIGKIPGDDTPPMVISTPAKTDSFDPSAPLTVEFSQPMDSNSLQSGMIVEAMLPGQGWTAVAGTVQVSADLQSATFVPDTGLQMGIQYRIRFTGVQSQDGKELAALDPIVLTTFRPQHICPDFNTSCPITFQANRIDDYTGAPIQFVDIGILHKVDPATNVNKTTLVAISDTKGSVNFLTYDVTDPSRPAELAAFGSTARKQRLTLVPQTTFTLGQLFGPCVPDPTTHVCASPQGPPIAWTCAGVNSTNTFNGDLAIATTLNNFYGIVTFFDVTDPTRPCFVGSKTLTVSPTAPASAFGAVSADGYPRRSATLATPNDLIAYVAVGQVGLMEADVSLNDASHGERDHQLEPYYPGDFQDVLAVDNQLLAVEQTAGDPPGQLDRFDASLNQLNYYVLPIAPLSLAYGEGLAVDLNGDGVITPDEVRNVAFVGGYREKTCPAGQSAPCYVELIEFIDETDPSNPTPLGSIEMPGIVRAITVDVARKRLYVRGGTSHYDNGNLFFIDISNLQLATSSDTKAGNPNDWDNRILSRVQYSGINNFLVDPISGLAFVATPFSGLDVVPITDACCDLAVDLDRKEPDGNTGQRDQTVIDETVAIQRGLATGLERAQRQDVCNIPLGAQNPSAQSTPSQPGSAPLAVTILEQGSGSCIWKPDHCGFDEDEISTGQVASENSSSNYQPGISDHDFEVFIPQQFFQGSVPHPDSTPDNPLPNVSPAACLATVLNDQFTDFATGAPIRIAVNGKKVSFEDISFFPVKKEEFLTAVLDLDLPNSAGSDPYGDLGLGRQQLLLKWLLEGIYVPVTLSDGSVVREGSNEDLDTILGTLQTNSVGIPPLEGGEWAVLQTFNLAKSMGFIRMQGADQEDSTLHGLFEKQVHDAAKAGVRAALAQMVAVPSMNARILSTSRAQYASGACVEPAVPNPLPGNAGDWVRDEDTGDLTLRACDSFEEYVASMAVRDADDAVRGPLVSVFTPQQAQQVYRFFRIKANQTDGTDDSDILQSEIKAEDFIALVARFIEAVKNDPRTNSAYILGIQGNPQASPPIPPDPRAGQRQTNLSHGLDAINQKLAQGTIPAKRSKNAGIHVFNAGSRDANGIFVRMFRDGNEVAKTTPPISLPGEHAAGYEQWLDFPVGTGGATAATNIYIQQGPTTSSQPPPDTSPHAVTFVIDLPERSVKEANRNNNWYGFHYWILDRSATTHSPPSVVADGRPPFPLSQDLLTPDPVCAPVPRITITQTVTNDHVHVVINNPTDTDLTNVRVCTDLGPQPNCRNVASVPAHGQQSTDLPITNVPNAATAITTATAAAVDSAGNTVPIARSQVVANIQSPIQITFFDNTPLSSSNHPFSRYARSHDINGNPTPIRGAVTDGTVNAVRIAISGLQTNQTATVTLIDADFPAVTDGLGQVNQSQGTTVTVSADTLGNATVYYTPPLYFLRPSVQRSDWSKGAERVVNVLVHQENVGTTTMPLALRRPPVFLLHGLGGQIDAFDQFQPLVPPVCTSGIFCKQLNPPADYYVPRPGFDGRFDLFNIGSPRASHHIADEASTVQSQIAGSLNGDNKLPFHAYLPKFAIGKIDVIAHSMGGLIVRRMTQDPVIAQAVRKLVIMNSPLAGTPLADQVVQKRDQYKNVVFPQLKVTPVDLFNLITSSGSSPDPLGVINACNIGLTIFGHNGLFNIYNGAVDDLQTTAAVPYTNTVPTHHVVTRTGNADIAGKDSGEVWLLWRSLGRFCGWTPDSSTVDRTTQLNAVSEIISTIVTAGFGIAKDGGVILDVPKQTVFLSGIQAEVKATKGAIFSPTPIFSGDNDRVVPLSSQLEGLPTSDPSVTYINGTNDVNGQVISSDHQQAKISPGVRVGDCVIQDQNGVPQFNIHASGPADLNNDGTPDVVCHVMRVLEANPTGALFKQP